MQTDPAVEQSKIHWMVLEAVESVRKDASSVAKLLYPWRAHTLSQCTPQRLCQSKESVDSRRSSKYW